MTEVYEAHPEIYHYTTRQGLRGIFDTQTLWATHYSALNDTSEIRHMRDTLVEKLLPHMRDLLKKYRENSFKVKREITKLGGLHKVAKREASGLVDTFYETTFGPEHHGVVKSRVPFAEPFIFSFCSHGKDDQYTQANGLLSQWRSYGSGEGFAMVFDTKRLCEFLPLEHQTYHYSTIGAGEVIYDDEKDKIEIEFKELFDRIKKIHSEMLDDISDNIPTIYAPFVNSVSRFKHRAFREEREVRIFACPDTQELIDKLRVEQPEAWKREVPKKKTKTVHLRSGGQTAYIELFDFEDRISLPITRIIVGPHKDQANLESEVKSLVRGTGIKVRRSDTPYIGR